MNYNSFKVDRKHDCISFSNGYWFPIQDFTVKYENDIYHGISHLMQKRWFNDYMLQELLVFLKSEFPDIDFTESVTKVKEHQKMMADFFKSLKINTNG